jgi:hypothetical protein
MVVLGLVALSGAGCLAVVGAAAVGGGIAGYAYYKGRVIQDFPASLAEVESATVLALQDLKLPPGEKHVPPTPTGGSPPEISITTSTADQATVTIVMEPAASRLPGEGLVTRVGVRVGTFGDQVLSQRILAQVAARLAQKNPRIVPLPAPVGPAGTPPNVVQGPQTPPTWRPTSNPGSGSETAEPPLPRR